MIDVQLLVSGRQHEQFVDTQQFADARQHGVPRVGRHGPVGSNIKLGISFNAD